jgi:hypothetical protein
MTARVTELHIHSWHRTWLCQHTDVIHPLRCSKGAFVYACTGCHASGYPIPNGVKA